MNKVSFLRHIVSGVSKICPLFLMVVLGLQQMTFAQEQQVNWLTFEQLDDSLSVAPKKVFISFYADWCAYCKKMDRAAFKDRRVIETLSFAYYAVKMNAESLDSIAFGGKVFVNKELGKKRRPTHELALLLASRNTEPFTLPAMILLNERFEVTQRYFSYLSPEALLEVLQP